MGAQGCRDNSPCSALGAGDDVTARIEHCVDGAVHADLALHGLRDARVHATLNRRLTRLLLAYGQIYLAGHGAAGTSRQGHGPWADARLADGRGAQSSSDSRASLGSLRHQIAAPLVEGPPRLVVHLATRVLNVEDVALAQLRILHEHGGDGALEIPGKLIGHHSAYLVAHVEGVALRDGAVQARGDRLLGQLDLQLLAIVVVIHVLQLESATQRLGRSDGAKGDAKRKETQID